MSRKMYKIAIDLSGDLTDAKRNLAAALEEKEGEMDEELADLIEAVLREQGDIGEHEHLDVNDLSDARGFPGMGDKNGNDFDNAFAKYLIESMSPEVRMKAQRMLMGQTAQAIGNIIISSISDILGTFYGIHEAFPRDGSTQMIDHFGIDVSLMHTRYEMDFIELMLNYGMSDDDNIIGEQIARMQELVDNFDLDYLQEAKAELTERLAKARETNDAIQRDYDKIRENTNGKTKSMEDLLAEFMAGRPDA